MTNAKNTWRYADTFCSSGPLENWKYLLGASQRRWGTRLYLDIIRSKLEWLWADFTIKVRLISVSQRPFNKNLNKSWPLQHLSHLPPFPLCWNQNAQRMRGSGCILGCSSQKKGKKIFFYFPFIILRDSWGQVTVAERGTPLRQQKRAIAAALTAPMSLHLCIFDCLVFAAVDGVWRLNVMCSNRC